MTKESARRVLVKAFGMLTLPQLENLRYHLAQKTPILCGNRRVRSLEGKSVPAYLCYIDVMGGA